MHAIKIHIIVHLDQYKSESKYNSAAGGVQSTTVEQTKQNPYYQNELNLYGRNLGRLAAYAERTIQISRRDI